MSTPDPFVSFLLIWMGASAAAVAVDFLTYRYSFEQRTARRHKRDWRRLQKNCAAAGVACPNREFSDTLSDLNYYEIPGP